MYRRDVVGVQASLEAMTAQTGTVSERSWRRLAEVVADLNDARIIRTLIAGGLPVECTYSALCIAARNNHVDVLRALLEAGAPVNG